MAENNSTVEVKIEADTTGLNTGLSNASKDVKSSLDDMEEGFAGANEEASGLINKFIEFETIRFVADIFKEITESTIKFEEEIAKTSLVMGITTEQASVLSVALGSIGSTTDSYISTYEHFARQLKANEDTIESLGVKTRAANGAFLDTGTIFNNALAAVTKYKAGIDQTEVSQTLFGRSIDEALKLQRLTPEVMREAADEASRFGVVIGGDDVKAMYAFQAAEAQTDEVTRGLKKVISDELMPTLDDLFKSIGSYAPQEIESLSVGFGTLAEVISIVLTGFINLAQFISGVLVVGIFTLSGAFIALRDAIKGNGKAIDDLKISMQQADIVIAQTGKDMDETYSKNIQRLAELEKMMQRVKDQAQGTGNNVTENTTIAQSGNQIAPTGATDIDNYTNKLQQLKIAYTETLIAQGQFGEMSKQMEADYWKNILETENLSQKQKLAVQKEYQNAEIEAEKKKYTDLKALRLEQIQDEQNAELARLKIQETGSKQQLALGNITKTEELKQEQEYENKSYDIQIESLQKKLALAQQDPNLDVAARQKILDQMLELQRTHEQKILELKNQTVIAEREYELQAASDIKSAFADVITNIVTGQNTLLGALTNFITSVSRALASAAAKSIADQIFTIGSSAASSFFGGGDYSEADLESMSFRADGGSVNAGMPYVVGERGAELFVPNSNGTIIPNGAGAGAVNVINHFNIQGQMDGRSQQQIAAKVGESVNRAARRNN